MCASCAWTIEAGFAGAVVMRAAYVSRLRERLGRAADPEETAPAETAEESGDRQPSCP